MQSRQALPRSPAPPIASRRPTFGWGRPAGLYGEVLTLPLGVRGMTVHADRKTSL